MRTRARVLGLLAAAVLCGTGPLEAQYRVPPGGDRAWPSSWSPDLSEALGDVQEQRLPVYDDQGVEIPFGEIEARIDRSGLKGMFFGALLGSAAGALAGWAASPQDCNEQRGGLYYGCSPREDALRSALPSGFALVLGVLGGWVGWNADVTTWDEALREIRAERRQGGAR